MAAGIAVDQLAEDMADQPVVFLEQDVDTPVLTTRLKHWWDSWTGAPSVVLPLAMVSGGHRVKAGSLSYYTVYHDMVEAELSRPPQASIEAYSRRIGSTGLRVYSRFVNLSGGTLETQSSAVTVLVWEDVKVGVTSRTVRAGTIQRFPAALPDGGVSTMTFDLTVTDVDWAKLHTLVLADVRPGGVTGPWDMLQAHVATPPALTAEPSTLSLSTLDGQEQAEVALGGPYVATWTAASDAPWLEADPGTGALPATVRVTLRPELLVSEKAVGHLTITATSTDGLSLSRTIEVSGEHPRIRPVRRRLDR